MNTTSAPEEILSVLKENGGRMDKVDLICSFTSGEWPSDMLLAVLTEGINHLTEGGKIALIGDEYFTMPSLPSMSG